MENQMSLIEIALKIIESCDGPINIYDLLEKTLKEKGITDEDGTIKAKLYTDITISSKFVYMGEDNWDLKSRQSLDQFDKDGSSFISKADEYEGEDEAEEVEEDDDSSLYEDDEYDEESEEEDDEDYEDDEESDEEEDELDAEYEDEESEEEDDEDSYNDEDEDKYNKIMDDYEDLYED